MTRIINNITNHQNNLSEIEYMYKIVVKGIVQGVGFRPYIYRKAKLLNVLGYVKNIGSGVEILVNDKDFFYKLTDLPPLAKIIDHSIEKTDIPQKIFPDFAILKSEQSEGETLLPPDIYMCDDCLNELKNKSDRRNDYYFITCTNCGPRFTIIEDYPYDRPLTSMKEFEMCPECKKEYTDPLNRRYHAQTIACKKCGPRLRLLKNSQTDNNNNNTQKIDYQTNYHDITECTDKKTIETAAKIIKSGTPIAIKGVGGFHLCSLSDDKSVNRVRHLLGRRNKPFALLVKDIEMLNNIVHLTKHEKEILQGHQRPIVVLKKINDCDFSEVSELDSLGVMLPYTALHYLLFDFIDVPLVMTSCNIPGEPVSITENIADYFLTHERKIVNRCDDSVIKVISNTPFFLRRSRGYTPLPIQFPIYTNNNNNNNTQDKKIINYKDTIALGAELNNVICTVKNNQCFLSQYIGETSKLETFNFLKETVDKFIKLTRLNPKIIACDLHPGYNSTILAKELAEKYKQNGIYNAELIQIQHHKAHIASVAAEHNLTDYIGIAMDGLGYGEDGNIWGGEVFDVKDNIHFKRIGHLEEQPQLGGDSATLNPKKMLFGILSNILNEKELLNTKLFDENETNLYIKQLNEKFNVQKTTSTGRILDAASAFLGLCDKRTYDGRPAMILESIAKNNNPYHLPPLIENIDGRKVLSTSKLFKFLLEEKKKSKSNSITEIGKLASTVQSYLANGLLEIAKENSEKTDKPIVFSGGVAYNRMISRIMLYENVLVNKNIPAGDGGICYGQAYLANLMNEKKN